MKKIEFMLITKEPEIATYIETRGVGRIFIDMETKGKQERQANQNTPINSHSYEDLKNVKSAVKEASVMLRINPLHEGTRDEVNKAIDHGADVIMLPYFRYPEEVESFLEIVDQRVRTNILFESSEAVGRAEQILSIPGLQEVHFGLNDLKISLGTDFLFEAFAGGLIEWLCSRAKKYNLNYGVGGIGRVGKEMLPADLIMKENIRVGSQRIILSRVFHNGAENLKELLDFVDFENEVAKLREVEEMAHSRTPDQVAIDQKEFARCVGEVSRKIRQ